MFKPALIAGSAFAALAVVLGAFGAHGLKSVLEKLHLEPYLDVFNKGVTYQFYHAFALIVAGILFSTFPFDNIKWATWLFTAGIIMFSGSLYLLVFLKTRGMSIGPAGIITPIGGLCFIAGWIFLLLAILKKS